ncbi:MAG: tetratricopeptide repeat protein [Bacteroidota bacterium]|nr:tetratricopeptide repeat protein [Bacteroidota bacterium]
MRTTILVGLLVLFLFDINAQHNITDSLEKAISTSSPDELQQIYFQLSEEFKKTDLIKAKFYSQKAISASEDDNKMLGLAYFSMATIYGIQHKQDTVIFYMKKALNCFDATNDSTLDASIPDMIFSSLSYFDNQFKIESLNKFAQRYFYNKPYLSRIICSKSLEFALDENKPDLLADTYKMLGFINKTLGNLNKALEYDNEAYKLYIELNDSLNIGFTLNLIAVVRNMKGENDIALSRFMDAEKYLLALYKNDTHNKSVINRLSILYTNIGLLYSFQLMNYKEAEKYFNKVIDYAEQTNDTVRINASLANLGHVYLETKDYKKALNYFKQALDIATHTKNFYFAARITHNIGKLYEKQEEFENSREYYRIALDMMKRLNDQFGICRTNRIIGESYLKQKKAKPALDHFYPALNFAVKSNSEDEIKMIYFDLSKIYEIDSNIDSAYHYFKLYTDVNNEINNEQSRKRFEELQVKYESEKKEKENKFLREETQIQERLKYYLFFIISALLILSVLLISEQLT